MKKRKFHKGLKGTLFNLNKMSDNDDGMFVNDDEDDKMSISSMGLQSFEDKTFDMGDREAEKEQACKNIIYTNIMAANQNNPH